MPQANAAALLLACALLAAPPAPAQEWPARPLHLVVPVAPGGQPDVVARVLASELARRLAQPVLVENRPGAQTNIGMEAVARAAPDGYTFLFALTSLSINPHLQKLPFNPLVDFAPVALLSRFQFVLMASRAVPAASPAELIALAHSRPGGLSCAHAGGITQIACALFGTLARVPVALVPYRGLPLAYSDLARGEVHMLFENLVGSIQQDRRDQVRALAVTGGSLGSAPLTLPPLADTLPGFDLTGWQGVVAPAGTPAPVVRRMNEAIGAAMQSPGVAQRLSQDGTGRLHGTPEEFGAFLRAEHERYERIVAQTGMRVD